MRIPVQKPAPAAKISHRCAVITLPGLRLVSMGRSNFWRARMNVGLSLERINVSLYFLHQTAEWGVEL
jgi:hypothetical protein